MAQAVMGQTSWRISRTPATWPHRSMALISTVSEIEPTLRWKGAIKKAVLLVLAVASFCGLVTSLPGRADLLHMEQNVADAYAMIEHTSSSRRLQKSGKKVDKTGDMEGDKKSC